MDNIRRSVSNLVKQKSPHSNRVSNDDKIDPSPLFVISDKDIACIERSDEDRKLPFNNPHREREIMESIDPVYYSDSDVDCSEYELKNLLDLTDLNKINERRKCMKEQLVVATKKIFNYILENYPSYSAELTKVMELQELIQHAYMVCQQSRRHLGRAESVLTVSAFSSMSKHRKRSRLLSTLDILAKIKTMQTTDGEIRRMLEEEDVVNAIRLCLECKTIAALYKEYSCISDLSRKLQTTLVNIESRLDDMLASCSVDFEPERFNKIIEAYEILDRLDSVPEKVILSVQSAVEDTCTSVVGKYLEKQLSATEVVDKLQYFINQCKNLNIDLISKAFREILRLTWQIMFSFHNYIAWTNDQSSDQVQHFHQALAECLTRNLASVFENVSSRLSMLIENINDVTSMKFTDFMEILWSARKFVDLGFTNFCSRSLRLQDALKRFCMKFLDWHHKACLFELKQFLCTENWHSVPLERHFTYRNLPEFAFIKNVQISTSVYSGELPSSISLMNVQSTNPFSDVLPNLSDKDVSINSVNAHSDDVNENGDDIIDDKTNSDQSMNAFEASTSFKCVDKLAPIVCNSSLNLLRLIGKYLEVAWIFSSVSFEILSMVLQLFDFYFYALFVSLTSHRVSDFWNIEMYVSARLKQLLAKLTTKYANEDMVSSNGFNGTGNDNQDDFNVVKFVVGSESMIFIARQMKSLEYVFRTLLPPSRSSFCEQFFNQVLSCVEDIRNPIYGQYCFLKIKWSFLLSSIESVNWEIQELMSQHSNYVTFLLQDFDQFQSTIHQANVRLMNIPKEVYESLISCWVKATMRLLVEGYSSAKKCTNQGRALMQLDFQNLLMQLEKRTGIKPLPDKDYVDAYVKAYYLPESLIEENINRKTASEPVCLAGGIAPELPRLFVFLSGELQALIKRAPFTRICIKDCLKYSEILEVFMGTHEIKLITVAERRKILSYFGVLRMLEMNIFTTSLLDMNNWNEYSSKQIIGLINVTNQLTKKTRLRLIAVLENSNSQAVS